MRPEPRATESDVCLLYIIQPPSNSKMIFRFLLQVILGPYFCFSSTWRTGAVCAWGDLGILSVLPLHPYYHSVSHCTWQPSRVMPVCSLRSHGCSWQLRARRQLLLFGYDLTHSSQAFKGYSRERAISLSWDWPVSETAERIDLPVLFLLTLVGSIPGVDVQFYWIPALIN